jgi:dTDP-4-amino-4,6-dideoxygalactose transaminase
LDLPPGSEIITTPFTFVATINACLLAGFRVRFSDISIDDFALNSDSLGEAISERTRAILPVHLYGQSADMPRLVALSKAFGLAVVEDAAQAFLARHGKRATGTWGIGCFSLYATKNLTAGEGGLVTTDDDKQADWIRKYRNQGMAERYVYEIIGENLRMTELQAAVALPQLDTYEKAIEIRTRNAAMLREGLSEIEWLVLPKELPGRRHVWHQFTVLVGRDAPFDREYLARELATRGVGSGFYYPKLLGDYPHIGNDPRVALGRTPNARTAAATCISLPVHPSVSEDDIARIVASVVDIAQKA